MRAVFRTTFLLFLGGLGLLVTIPVQAQPALVRGFVTDADDGRPLGGATVALWQDGTLVTGTATDGDGLYVLPRLAPGTYRLRATFVGYAPSETTLDLIPGAVQTLSIALEPDAEALGEVVVEEAAPAPAGQQTLRPAEIARLPAPDVAGDLANALAAQPGVVTTGDQGGQFYVRGGEPSQNLVLVDGMPVYQPFHLLGFYSMLPGDVVSRADVYAGGFGPKYGGRLSSVIDVATRPGNLWRIGGAVSLSPFVSGLRLEGPLVPGRLSVLASGRRSFLEEAAEPLTGADLPYQFDDQFVKLTGVVGPGSRVSVQALRTYDRGQIGSADPDRLRPNQVAWTNWAGGVRLVMLPAERPISAEVVASFSSLDMEVGPEVAPLRTSSIANGQGRADVTHYFESFDLNWGLYIGTSAFSYTLGGLFQLPAEERTFATEGGAYASLPLRLGALEVTPGLRLHTFPNQREWFAEPRAHAVWQRGRHRLSAAFGRYHQQIIGLSDRRDATGVFTAWLRAPTGGVSAATHLLAGYAVELGRGLSVSAEAYTKELERLYVSGWTTSPSFNPRLATADGTARGLDVRADAERGALRGSLRYSLADVDYRASFLTPYDPPHDRQHQLTALGSARLVGFDLSVRWQFGSGLPFSRPLGFDGIVSISGPFDPFTEPDQPRVQYGLPYGERLPTFHRLDVSAARTLDLGRADVTVQASLLNAYDRANIFYLDLYTFERRDQLPLTPSVGLQVAFD